MLCKYLQFLIDDAREKRSQRLDAEPTSFIEVFLDKIKEYQGNDDTIFTRKFFFVCRFCRPIIIFVIEQ